MRSTIASFAVVGVLAIALAGCSIGTATSKPSVAPSLAPSPTSTASGVNTSGTDAFGAAHTWSDGTSISVSAPAPFTASEYAAGVTPGQTQLLFTLVLTNGTKSTITDPFIDDSMSSGGTQASAITDIGNPIGDIGETPSTAILPGQTIKWLEAYSVADPANLTFEIEPGIGYKPAIFTNIKQ
jgi:hypothetical protein